MKSIAIFLVTLLTLISGTFAFAGGCYLENVTESKWLASEYMANLVRNKVLDIEKRMNAKGEKIQMVFVARRGENMSGLRVFKDDPNVPLQTYLYELYNTVQSYDANNDQNSQPLPDQLFSNKPLIYSHMGLLLKHDDGYLSKYGDPNPNSWVYISHLLAQCNKTSKRYGTSEIFDQKFPHFFWDTKVYNPRDDSALVIVPSPELQSRLMSIYNNRKIAFDAIHEPKYNVAAVPFRFRRPDNLNKPDPFFLHWQMNDQNSDQWPLELIAAAELPPGTPIVNRYPSQKELWNTNYRPTIVRATGFIDSIACTVKRGPILPWGGHMWDASNLLNCFDQVFRPADIYQFVTVDSVVQYLERNHLLADNVYDPGSPGVYEVKADPKLVKLHVQNGKILEQILKLAQPKHQNNDNE